MNATTPQPVRWLTPALLATFCQAWTGMTALYAQAPTPPAAAEVQLASPENAAKTQEILELSPFEVRESDQDRWDASSTLLGNRIKQDLVKVPLTVSVLTKEFMSDVGVFELDDAGAFVAGVTSQPRIEARNDSGRITFRGLTSSSERSRNFFIWYVPADTYNVERFDFGMGSNSLMFGDSRPGGQAIITTKRPRFANANEVLAYYDSEDSHRVQLDVNRKVSRNLAIRFNAVDRSNKSYVKGNYQLLRAADLAFTYRPFPNTAITVEAERGNYERRRAGNADLINTTAAPGGGFSTSNRWYLTSDGNIINNTTTGTLSTKDKAAPGGAELSLLEGQSRAVLMPDGTAKIFRGFSRSFNIQGPFDYLDRPYNAVTATIEQNIGKVALQASYNQQFQHEDRNDSSLGGATMSPTFWVDGSGRPYVQNSGSISTYKIFGNIVKVGRLSAAYAFELGKWTKQNLVLTGSRTKDYASNRRLGWANAAAAGNIANNGIIFRAYLDDPHALEAGGWDRFQPANLPQTATFKPQLFDSYLNTSPFVDVRYTTNYTASLAGEYLGGRLTSLVGLSYNRIARKIPTDAAYATDALGRVTFWGTPDNAPQFFTYDPGFSLSARSWTCGLNYALLKTEHINANVYGAYAQSFNWQNQAIFTGQVLGPITGTTSEAGIKGDVFRGKLSYTVAVYEIARKNAGYTWSPSFAVTSMEDLFNPNNLLPSDPKYFHVQTGLNSERNTVNSQEKSKGVDLTLMGQRIHGLQPRVTFSRTQVEATRDFSEFARLLNDAVARTNAANAPGGDKTQAESASFIATAQAIVAGNTNTTAVTGRRSVPYTASVVLDYQFARLTGLRVGLSAVWTPNYNLSLLNNVMYKGGASCPIGLYAIYSTKILRRPTTFRLGANRVHDLVQGSSAYYKTDVQSIDATTGKPNWFYRYTDPMTTNLSATVHF